MRGPSRADRDNPEDLDLARRRGEIQANLEHEALVKERRLSIPSSMPTLLKVPADRLKEFELVVELGIRDANAWPPPVPRVELRLRIPLEVAVIPPGIVAEAVIGEIADALGELVTKGLVWPAPTEQCRVNDCPNRAWSNGLCGPHQGEPGGLGKEAYR